MTNVLLCCSSIVNADVEQYYKVKLSCTQSPAHTWFLKGMMWDSIKHGKSLQICIIYNVLFFFYKFENMLIENLLLITSL